MSKNVSHSCIPLLFVIFYILRFYSLCAREREALLEYVTKALKIIRAKFSMSNVLFLLCSLLLTFIIGLFSFDFWKSIGPIIAVAVAASGVVLGIIPILFGFNPLPFFQVKSTFWQNLISFVAIGVLGGSIATYTVCSYFGFSLVSPTSYAEMEKQLLNAAILGAEAGAETGVLAGAETGGAAGAESGQTAGRLAGEESGATAGAAAGVDILGETGRLLGEEAGRAAGSIAGSEAGLSEGALAGAKAGAKAGAEAGIRAGLENARKAGLEAGKTAGAEAGTKAGAEAGEDAGKNAGATAGESAGTISGKEAAETTLATDTTHSISSPGIVSSNELSANNFTPSDGGQRLYELIEIDPIPDTTAENITVYAPMISDKIMRRINTRFQADSLTINSDIEFTSLISSANAISASRPSNSLPMDELLEVIRLREEACKFYLTRELCRLLSDNYSSLAYLYTADSNLPKAYDAYLNALRYQIVYLQFLSQEDDTYYSSLYYIAVLYQHIGDLPTLDIQTQQRAYFLSACFYENVCMHVFNDENESLAFNSSYYAAMLHHKLLQISWKTRDKSTSFYISKAYAYYSKSLEYTNFTRQRPHQYKYLSEICQHAQDYLSYYGTTKGLLSKPEYAEKQTEFERLSNSKHPA